MQELRKLNDYARLIVKEGVNLKPGQKLVITVPAEHIVFARILQETAYQCGAGKVEFQFTDDFTDRNDLLYASEDVLSSVRKSELLKRREQQDDQSAFLHIVSDHPDSRSGVDELKAGRIRQARATAFRPLRAYTMNSQGQWCVAAMPNEDWAKQVFPEIRDAKQAEEALYQAIFHSVCLDQNGDPAENWRAHGDLIRCHCEVMNQYAFEALHFRNAIGTDLLVPLVRDHIWGGGRELASKTGQWFDPNIPTEEIFTAPHCRKTEGKVVASRPLYEDGQIIDGFSFTFKKGKVAEWSAEKGANTLASLLESDEGSMRLGEVALVPYDSAISNLNLLFFNTLFDENAACHLALGACYPTSLKGGDSMRESQLKKAGGNVSSIHVDFMFGTEDLTVDGIQADGTKTEVFRNGNFVF